MTTQEQLDALTLRVDALEKIEKEKSKDLIGANRLKFITDQAIKEKEKKQKDKK